MNKQPLGNRLRHLRERLALSQRAAGLAAGVSSAYVSQLEHGQANVTLDALDQVVDSLGGVLIVDVAEDPRGAALAHLAATMQGEALELVEELARMSLPALRGALFVANTIEGRTKPINERDNSG